jgi:hypothetical protein
VFKSAKDVDEIALDNSVYDLFKTDSIQFVHHCRHGAPATEVMSRLKGDMNVDTGRLVAPENWNIFQKGHCADTSDNANSNVVGQDRWADHHVSNA